VTFPWSHAIRPGESVIRCPNPKCQTDVPSILVRTLSNDVIREVGWWFFRVKLVHQFVTGSHRICPRCQCEYFVGPAGAFVANKEPAPSVLPFRPASARDKGEEDDPPMPDFGVPSRPPRV